MKALFRRLRLAHRLSPWSARTGPAPAGRREVRWVGSGEDGLWMRFSEPPLERTPVGGLLVLHGLHYLGPDDARLDRLLLSLAEFGFLVGAPYLPSYLRLVPERSVTRHAEYALRALQRHKRFPAYQRSRVLTISFGSYPGLRLASGSYADELDGLICFGGYADWQSTMRFTLLGAAGRPSDPRSCPAVYLNLMDHMAGVPTSEASRRELAAHLRAWVRASWPDDGCKQWDGYETRARGWARNLSEGLKTAFLDGSGVSEDGIARMLAAIDGAGDALRWLDPRSHGLRASAVPITLVHGRDDNVIPVEQSDALQLACPPSTRLFKTGLYTHADPGAGLPGSELLQELRTLYRVLTALGADR